MQFESFHWLKPSWYMSHYTMLYKYGRQKRDFFWRFYPLFSLFFLYFGGVFNKAIIPFALVGYEIGYSQRALMK